METERRSRVFSAREYARIYGKPEYRTEKIEYRIVQVLLISATIGFLLWAIVR